MVISEEVKDVVERAAWTFLQAFLGVLLVASPAGWTVAMAGAAASAGLAAALSVVKTYVNNKVKKDQAPTGHLRSQ